MALIRQQTGIYREPSDPHGDDRGERRGAAWRLRGDADFRGPGSERRQGSRGGAGGGIQAARSSRSRSRSKRPRSAPAKEEAATDRCEGQTWPHLSRECSEQMQKNRPTRVVTTDRVEKPAPETPAAPRSECCRRVACAGRTCARRAAQSAAPAAAPSVSTSTSSAPSTFAPNTAAAARAGGEACAVRSRPSPQPSLRRLRQPPSLRRSRTVAVAASANPQDAIVANEPAATSKAAEKRKAKEAKEARRKQEEGAGELGR